MNTLDPNKLSNAVTYIDGWLEFNFDNSTFPGMQVAILHDKDVVYSRAFGYGDIDNKAPLQTSTITRIASHSKSITATAVMQLFEAGKLSLDDCVSKHLAWFTSKNDKRVGEITIRQLLNHVSGIARDGDDSDYWEQTREFPTEEELKGYFSTCRLAYDTDETFKYSNYGYGVLGLVIEAVSGVSYRRYVTENIIERLNLRSTWPDYDKTPKDQLATGYGFKTDTQEYYACENVDTKALSSATGFASNAEDLCRFFGAHFFGDTTLISDSAKRQMRHGSWASDYGNRYGLGVEAGKKSGRTLNGHSGGFPGFASDTRYDPTSKIAVSIIITTDWARPSLITASLIAMIDEFQRGEHDKKMAHNPAAFTGRFYTARGGTRDIVQVGDRLLSLEPVGWSGFDKSEVLSVKNEKTLIIERAGGFASPGEEVRFVFDEKGEVESLRYGGRNMVPHSGLGVAPAAHFSK